MICKFFSTQNDQYGNLNMFLWSAISIYSKTNTFIGLSDNCATGMGESQYSYGGLPDPASYFTSQGNIFICDNSGGGAGGHHHGPGPDNGGGDRQGAGDQVGLATPNTRARRVVHEVIV